MCGICGVWEYGAARGNVGRELLVSMRDVMTHRGPDDSGELVFDDARGGFGFRRLSIIDLSEAGHQPMRACTDRVWLVFNGEIYNHAALREGLEQRGHTYASRTDSETILHLYEERELDFVQDIEGDFGIAIWDADRERLVLARDRAGVKPLYFYQTDGRFIFASEIKAILQHPAVTAEVNEEALYHYLTLLTTPAPHTLFRGIQKIPAGHMLVVERNGETRLTQYWDALPPQSTVAGVSEEEHQQRILELLRDSIKKRMMADVPFGVFLSGGVDSSANVALMSELMTQPVRTFTVGFHDTEELNELEAARALSKRYNTDHHEVIIGRDEMEKFLPELVFHQDEPIADPVCVPLYYVSKLARDSGTIVVQVGEGSDEIFGGYDWFGTYLRIEERFWRYAERAPLAARRAAAAVAVPLAQKTFKKQKAGELIRRLGKDQALFWGGVGVFDETTKPKVLSAELRARHNGLSTHDVVRQYLDHIARERPDSDFAARMTYLELKLRLPELLLMRVDKITMATSVEARVPFLDHHLIEYALGLPRDLKVKGTTGKHILKRALEAILPKDLLYKPKRGFGAPAREWFRGPQADELVQLIMSSRMRGRNFFDYKFVEQLADEHRRERQDWSAHLWALLNVSVWYDRWIK
ncbi:MAG TPA: asparagine synthase (glutamine-hydrolyzing) [Pyrinomonadaceae bacterium]|nr:asparagine synthase (glutamine-hydrolyzing) [Pyrinomonadaceae bacterium]